MTPLFTARWCITASVHYRVRPPSRSANPMCILEDTGDLGAVVFLPFIDAAIFKSLSFGSGEERERLKYG